MYFKLNFKKQKNVSSENLLDVARNHAANYFGEIAENPDFISLPIDELEMLIQKTNLNVKNEEQVYNAVLKWFKGIGLKIIIQCEPESMDFI